MLGLPLTYRKALQVFMIRFHLVSEAKIALYDKNGPTQSWGEPAGRGAFKGRAHLWCQPLRKTWIFDFQLCFSVVKLSGNITKMVGNRFLSL